jgi:hypothetical protein
MPRPSLAASFGLVAGLPAGLHAHSELSALGQSWKRTYKLSAGVSGRNMQGTMPGTDRENRVIVAQPGVRLLISSNPIEYLTGFLSQHFCSKLTRKFALSDGLRITLRGIDIIVSRYS